ncbi:lytic transglycosylase domain-containing protein [Sphingobacterium sp. SGG-5]|uniref:lytic transglycosylase domain-containing protein n=1 Tax=Sphingobacterium sp. SGG-5 TaxID=2710881 RepID=UPI001F0FD209|nr:lytic transglycosylase domain-containing protein [Sphingobacterium sp. SGG-5]
MSRLYSTPHVDPIEDPYKKKLIEFAEKKVEEKKNAIASEEDDTVIAFADENLPIENQKVKRKLKKYLAMFSFKKHQSYRLHQQAEKHLPKIAEILKSHDIPEDFKYIPLVESGLNPRIRSHRGAGGYWQFMPATARLFGLKVNGNVDERKDLVKSTHAAARYLNRLYTIFGDWTLVAAAYNLGEGRLKSSMRRQNENNYYQLALNGETGSYVYKLVSMKEIIEKPAKYGYNI